VDDHRHKLNDSDIDARLKLDTRLECRICWHVYDPAEGDEIEQIPPGTPFAELPEHWRCPQCDSDKGMFLPIEENEEN
jgi:rubredoxin